MSVSPNSHIAYSTTENFTESISTPKDGAMAISVTTRIDYNLRFTKQAVLVVSEDNETYSQLASQFLVNLSTVNTNNDPRKQNNGHINVAFISASSKLNDIQIRCRIIEQLFVNTLFDPEQSLAVSVLRLAQQQKEVISIVIDHAHALSLQVKYELCQLVNLAKKYKLTINVVLFALVEAGQQLTTNKSLFNNKITVIDAKSGELISLDDAKLALKKNAGGLLFWQKISLGCAITLIGLALSWIYLLIVEDINEQTLTTPEQMVLDERIAKPSVLENVKHTELVQGSNSLIENKNITEQSLESVNTADSVIQATSAEIKQVLMATLVTPATDPTTQPVKSLVQSNEIKSDSINNTEQIVEQKTEQINESKGVVNPIRDHYYQNKAKEYRNGYVIQIAVFSDETLAKRFLSRYPEDNFYSYQKRSQEKTFTIITSEVFLNKDEARASIQLLSPELIERTPWLKSISAVINEINTFK